MRDVVITGMGAVSGCGIGADALWYAARDGRSGIKSVTFPEIISQRVPHAAALSEADKETVFEKYGSRLRDPIACYALMAAQEAVSQAGLRPSDFDDRCGVSIGSAFGGAQTLNKNYMTFAGEKSMRLEPMAVPKIMNNAAAAWVAMEFNVAGPTWCLTTACSSASQSIGMAAQMIRAGVIDRCIAGGSEACLESGVFRVWELLRVMSATGNAPFSKDRNGMILGEGAGVLVLEERESAEKRGAEILCDLAGYATTTNVTDLLRPDIDSTVSCMNKAMADAQLDPADLGYINAHGTGTVANDVAEAAALHQVFGDDLGGTLVSSTKPVHGHTLGSVGAIEAIVAINALREQMAPPTLNFTQLDPAIGIDPVGNTKRAFTGQVVMSNSLAFGGINASLIFRKAP